MFCAASIFPDALVLPAILQLLLGIASLIGGVRFYRYVTARLEQPGEAFSGLASVIIPCKGLETGLEENLKAILNQSRRNSEFIFVVEDQSDPAVLVIDKVRKKAAGTKLIFAGTASESGQKVHNLTVAVSQADPASAAFVFVDSDARPSATWLFDLLSPLADSETICSSGYRWFLQERGGLGTHIRSAWNASIVSALGENNTTNFCWGGSTAIRRSDFQRLEILSRWKGTVSDDFVMTNAIRESGNGVHFEPKCLIASTGDCSVAELLEFTTRQMKITRVYSPKHFSVSLTGSLLFTLIFFPGLAALLVMEGPAQYLMALTLVLTWMFGSAKALLRVYTAQKCLPDHSNAFLVQYFMHAALWPISSALFLLNDLAALKSRTISWRGITYELVSERDTQVLNNE